MRVLAPIAEDEEKNSLRKGTTIRLPLNVLATGIYTDPVYCSQDESKYHLMLNNQKPNGITIKNGSLGYTFLDCTQETTQMGGVIDYVAFI